MNEPGYLPEDQAQIDSRANLFYFLHTLSSPARVTDREAYELSRISDEDIEVYQKPNVL